MPARILQTLLSWIVAAALLAIAQPALAAPVAATCVAYSDESAKLDREGIAELKWSCDNPEWQGGQAVSWLRFTIPENERPDTFSSRITAFSGIVIAALAQDGSIRSQTFSPQAADPIMAGAIFTLPLPQIRPDTAAYIVRIERAHSVTVASEARISDDPASAHDALTATLIIALVAGMLLTLLLFDINFYLVLRERFVLLHAIMVISMMGYILFGGGLISAFVDLPVTVIAVGGPLCWTAAVAFAAFFMTAFLEPNALRPWMRQMMMGLGWWTLLVPGFFALQLPATQQIDNTGYFYAFAPVLVLYTLAILCALWRGSRAARFLAVAWLPIIIAAAERLLRGLGLELGLDSGSIPLEYGLIIAMGIEVIIIALGVADRFLAVRRERDSAVDEARNMVELSERDPLTGLLNRRALEMRFSSLRNDGFHTLALVDLDMFKDINDRFGHRTGDAVLRSVAAALVSDREALAFRLGGEEFMLLLRGNDTMNRAERLRRGIPTRVASETPGLDRIVTASAGLINMAGMILPTTNLDTLYDRADKLLYEAKETGRNRMVSEKLNIFQPRSKERRKDAA